MPQNILSADHIAKQNGAFEPQRKNNFTIEIILDSPDDQELILSAVASGFLPGLEFDEIEIGFGNERRYAAGRPQYEAGTLTIRDYVDKDVRGAIERWLELVYDPNTAEIGNAADYKKVAYIVMTGPNGQNEAAWNLEGVWPKSVKRGELDYDSSDQNKIELTLRYDKAIREF